MNIDLELYRVFCEVAKNKNISKTAEKMYISQSAITQSIQKLEFLLGAKVFYRNKTGVELTEEGRNLFEYINNSVETMNNAENIFSNYLNLEKGKIRIGGGNSLIGYLIFDSLLEFMKKYPNIEISISNGLTDSLMQKLSNGELDIVVLNLPFNTNKYSNIEITPLKKSEYCFFGGKEYVKKNKIKTMDDIKNSPLILPKFPSAKRKIMDAYCEKEKIQLEAKYEISSSSLMKRLILSDIGIGFNNVMNLKDVEDEITIIKSIKGGDAEEGIATLKEQMSNKASIELVKMIKSKYKFN